MVGKPIDITGKRYGKLTAIKLDHIEHTATGTVHYWLYKCDCGKEKVIRKGEVSQGGSRSCGCLLRESVKERTTTHGDTKTRLYTIYKGMKRRCLNPKFRHYKSYGARGIKICDEWLKDYLIFKKWALNNGYNENLTIERINVNGNYEPSNCKWIPLNEQSKNTRRTYNITANKETHCISDWAKILDMNAKTLSYRVHRNKDYIEEILKKENKLW